MNINIVSLAIGLFVGIGIFLIFYFIKKSSDNKKILNSSELAKKIIADAKQEAETLKKTTILEAKEKWFGIQKKYEEEINNRKKEIHSLEREYNERVSRLDKRLAVLEKKENYSHDIENKLKSKENQLQLKEKELDELIEQQNSKLSEIAKLSRDEAVQILMNNLKNKARNEAAKKVRMIAEQTKAEANRIAAGIISTAIQRVAVDYVSESTVSVVSLPDDEMKGRIIGREGRNIRSIEAVTGVDLIIDDTPEAITISDFNPVRREIAAITVKKLVADGRIHPGRIEEIFDIATKEVWKNIKEAGEQALFDLGIHKLHPELVLLIGRLRYRTSYGQNVWRHSIETGFFAGLIAAELGLNTKIYRRAGLLHDIGKAVDHEVEGSHAVIGAKLAEKYGESKKIVHAIMTHHNDEKPETVMDFIIQAADALSGARPGARREMTDLYIQRLADLEKIATDFEGVDKAFAIQAGRELRVMVDTSKINDENAYILANNIAKKVEEELTYPGQIKVIVIREKRVISVAQ